MIDCDLCGKKFDPHNQPFDEIGGLWICCGSDYTPEELAERLDMSVDKVYEQLGLAKEEK